MRKFIGFAIAFGFGLTAAHVYGSFDLVEAKEMTLEKEYINPMKSWGFTNTVTTASNGVKTIHVSGQTGQGDGHEAQADAAFKGVVEQLKAAGATPEDVVKLNVYIVNLSQDAVQGVGAAKSKYFTAEDQPASTWVGVTSLVMPQMLVEIEAVAVIEE